jgi:integrase
LVIPARLTARLRARWMVVGWMGRRGSFAHVIQVLLGHAHTRTTEIYTHVSPAHARSPLDAILPATPTTGDQ